MGVGIADFEKTITTIEAFVEGPQRESFVSMLKDDPEGFIYSHLDYDFPNNVDPKYVTKLSKDDKRKPSDLLKELGATNECAVCREGGDALATISWLDEDDAYGLYTCIPGKLAYYVNDSGGHRTVLHKD